MSYGHNWCIQRGYKNIILEVHSTFLTKWFLKIFDPPWRICRYVQELQGLAKRFECFQCVHKYGEANGKSYFLS